MEDAFWTAMKTILDSMDAASAVFLGGGPLPMAQNRPTLAAQPQSPIKPGCTARKGHMACEREAWHPAAHTSGGVNWYSGDAPRQTEAALRRIEEVAKGKP